MSETNKSYRIRTNVGNENKQEYITINADLVQDYDTFDILSVNIKSKDTYQLHNSNYGVVVGRVIANNGFGIPNAKVSIFIQADANNGVDVGNIYPFNSVVDKDKDGVRYNLLPNERVDGCHQVVGTFPTKRYALDNDVILEVFDNYYTYTTKTNNAGDYMICGVPVGTHMIHMDLDLSDCGILSQKPRDFVYKGYTIEQFESPTKFKGGTDYSNLSQIFSQDQVINVNPFWGNTELGETIGISRCDINVNFKFEPTCVFMGSIVSDNASNGFSQKCIPTDAMGYMDELVTGEGKIEMIRKTPGGAVEEFQIKGNKLINADGVWCYQIPMNLDYMVTDEYGNMVPTDNPEKGIPTRASVRFRISMEDSEENTDNFFRAKVLVPHNPKDYNENYDYEFGSYTKDESFRDLYWNNVYTVKSYIPRIQRQNNYKKEKFSGIKHCNKFGPNNPMPYNNIRIKMPFMFTIMCAIIKAYIFIVSTINTITVWVFNLLCTILNGNIPILVRKYCLELITKIRLIVLKDGLCPDLENWYFAPCHKRTKETHYFGCTENNDIKKAFKEMLYGDEPKDNLSGVGFTFYEANPQQGSPSPDNCDEYIRWYPNPKGTNGRHFYNEIEPNNITSTDPLFWYVSLLERTLQSMEDDEFEEDDEKSIDYSNRETDGNICLTIKTDYLLACIEMNLAQEYNVINFDFYNDWINGVIYNPRWMRYIKKKVRFLWITWAKEKVKGCMDDTKIFHLNRKYVQQCAIGYEKENVNGYNIISKVNNPINSQNGPEKLKQIIESNNFHKRRGIQYSRIFGWSNGGICHEGTTLKGQKVYYLKPCEFEKNTNEHRKTNFYATDIVLLGTFNDCDLNGIPKTFTHLTSTTYIMPTNLALTNMDTNGPLYANDNDTFCFSNEMSDGIKEISQTAEGPLGKELKFYTNTAVTHITMGQYTLTIGSDEYNYNISDKSIFGDNNTEGDTIALTEAAGISWNWTGPGQGEINEERMYYPGGHFLGLSCVNSQTNIKSCLNLSRICEIGANMSQRHEDVRSVGEGLKYTYTVPTGFISGDEISDSDFRTMFATLNKKRLIAGKRDKRTGYKIYDFEFAQPINFDGAFNNIVYYATESPYNSKIDVIDEDLRDYGVKLTSDNNEDIIDYEESANTQTRTREFTSLDYYLYRLGLNYSELNGFSNVEKKFLVKQGTKNKYKYYLPQYENSYYFYFGLKEGATALDEFNKQFYAECDEIRLKNKPKLILATEINFCEAKGNIHIITEGLTTPYQHVRIEGGGEVYEINVSSSEEEIKILNKDSFFYPDGEGNPREFEFGRYKVSVMDDDDIELIEYIDIGSDLFNYDKTVVNFTKPIETVTGYSIYNGGFVLIENFQCTYEYDGNVEFSFGLYNDGALVGSYEYIEDIGHLVYGDDINVNYELCIIWRCEGGNENTFKIDNVLFKDNRDIDLIIGYSGITASCIYNDYMSGMSESFWWDKDNADIGPENGTDSNDKWFFRKMFFKESNLNSFNSHVYPSDGCRKVLWGSAQQQNNNVVSVGLDTNLYCSERYYDIPAGKYLDDTIVIKPTYGVNYCEIDDEILRGGNNDSNCINQYCAQAYKDNEVCGEYRGTYNITDGVVLDENYFHEGYGCVFKPLPYGNLLFFEYNSVDELRYKIEFEDIARYGVIYPTFIYPVMKRPFFGDYSLRIYGDYDVNINENYEGDSYSIKSRSLRNNILLNIHNGITYNRYFKGIEAASYGLGEDEVLSADTYGLSLDNSVDRIFDCSRYEEVPFLLDNGAQYNIASFIATEGYPTDIESASALAKTISVYEEYSFYDNLYYKYNTDIDKITDVAFEGISDGDIEYYFGFFNEKDNIGFIEIPDDDTDKKYAYNTDSQGNYIILLRFVEDIEIHESNWYTEFFAKIGLISGDNNRFNLYYEYVDVDGSTQIFDEIVSIENGDLGGSEINRINTILNLLNERNRFAVYDNPQGNGYDDYYWKVFPFVPVLNYIVRNGSDEQPISYESTVYTGFTGFKNFMSRLMRNRKLVPLEYLDQLSVDSIENKHLFAIGVKTLTSDEDNESLSYIYKVYPNPFRHLFFGTVDDYTITIIPAPKIDENDSGAMYYDFGKGEDLKETTITVASHPCNLRLKFDNNDGWCYYTINDNPTAWVTEKEIGYNGTPVNVTIHVNKNDSGLNRICYFFVESYYGALRDSKVIEIRQSKDYFPVEITANSITLGAGHHDFSLPFIANGGNEITASTELDWVTINEPAEMEINGNTNYEFTGVVKYNNGAERNGYITLTPENGESRNVIITQHASYMPPKIEITVRKNRIYAGNTTLYGTQYSLYNVSIWIEVKHNSNGTITNGIPEEYGSIVFKHRISGSFLDDNGQEVVPDTYEYVYCKTLNHENTQSGMFNLYGDTRPEYDMTLSDCEIVDVNTNDNTYTNIDYKINIINNTN